MAALAQAFDDGVEHGHEQQGQDRRGEHAAENGRSDGLPASRACPARYHQRHDAEDERECRHQDRPKPETGRFHRGVNDAQAFLTPALGELNDQNRVLGGKTDQHDEADLRIDVGLKTAHEQRQECTEQRQRHREQHMNGMDQLSYCAARIRNTKTMAKREHYGGDRSRLQFLVGNAVHSNAKSRGSAMAAALSIAVTACPSYIRAQRHR